MVGLESHCMTLTCTGDCDHLPPPPKGEREKAERVFDKIMVENFSNLMKYPRSSISFK